MSSDELVEILNDLDTKKADEIILDLGNTGSKSKMEENKDKKAYILESYN